MGGAIHTGKEDLGSGSVACPGQLPDWPDGPICGSSLRSELEICLDELCVNLCVYCRYDATWGASKPGERGGAGYMNPMNDITHDYLNLRSIMHLHKTKNANRMDSKADCRGINDSY